MNTPEEIAQHMRTLADFISEAEIALRGGEVVDLSHLEEEVGALCDQALSLSPEEARSIQPAMADLIARLEDLSGELEAFRAGDEG